MTWFIIENACHVVVVEAKWTITLKTSMLLIFLIKLLTHFKTKPFEFAADRASFSEWPIWFLGIILKSVGSSGIGETKSELMMYKACCPS